MATYWRISNHEDLSGEGGVRVAGRWHSKGVPIVYFAESPSGALLEHLVHVGIGNGKLPATYNLLEIEVTADLTVRDLDPLDALSWKQVPRWTQPVGDAWLAGKETPLARVPSAIISKTWNVLLNPTHPEAVRIRVVSAIREPFDSRLANGYRGESIRAENS
jgi:RES domain-containing protein